MIDTNGMYCHIFNKLLLGELIDKINVDINIEEY